MLPALHVTHVAAVPSHDAAEAVASEAHPGAHEHGVGCVAAPAQVNPAAQARHVPLVLSHKDELATALL